MNIIYTLKQGGSTITRWNFLLNISHILIDGLFDSVPMLLSFIAISFAVNEKETGLIISLAMMGTTLFGLSSKIFLRHFNFWGTVSLIVLIYGIGFFIAAFSASLHLTGFCFIIALSGYGAFHNIAFSYLTSMTPRLRLGQTIGKFTAIGDLGRIPFTSVATVMSAMPVLGFSGWRIICLIYGLGALLFSAYLFSTALGQEKTSGLSSTTSMKQSFPSFSLLGKRQYALPISASLFDAIASDHLFTFLPYLLITKGIDPKIIGMFALAFTCGCFLGKIACGKLVDRFGTRKTFVISELLMLVLLTLLVLMSQLFIVISISLLLGFVTKGTVPVIQSILGESVGDNNLSEDIFSLNTFFRGSMGMITPFLFGYISSAFDIIWIYALMGLAAFCSVLTILLMNHLRPITPLM